MLLKARCKQKASSDSKKDIITIARDYGILVKHVDNVVAELSRKERASVIFEAPSKVSSGNTSSGKERYSLRNLKSPFLKVEDKSR